MPVVARQDRAQRGRHVLALLWGRDQARNAGALGSSENGRRWRMVVAGEWQALDRLLFSGAYLSLAPTCLWRLPFSGPAI
jgi:hypothetical protein